ncbi:MAG: FAD-dependent oxidoreductase [Reyranellaceae bacterium]
MPSGALAIVFEGRTFEAHAGETVAAALAAHGVLALRQTTGGASRGVFCGMGVCSECVVEVDGRENFRACMLPVRDGMVIRKGPALASGFPDLPERATPRSGGKVRTPEVLIVGGGPAGLSAAKAAASAGAEVVLLDERAHLGGQYFKQVLTQRRAAAPGDDQARRGARLIHEVEALGVTVLSEAIAWGGFAPRQIAAVVAGEPTVFEPQQLILAPGAFERGVPMPGWTLPGYMTTGAAQTLLRSYRVLAGKRFLVAGNGPLNLQLAAELLQAGAQVTALVELAARPGMGSLPAGLGLLNSPDLLRDGIRYMATLKRHGVPIHYGCAVVAAEGEDKVERARIARLDGDGKQVPGAAWSLDVDVVCVGNGFVPSNELARALGCRHSYDSKRGTLATDVDGDRQTSVPGVFVAGDGAGMSGARAAEEQGFIAGCAAARNVGRRLGRGLETELAARRRRLSRHESFQDALWTIYAAPRLHVELAEPDTVVCRCENVTRGQIAATLVPELQTIGSIKRLTRAGMGRCQGRYCGAVLMHMAPHPSENACFAPRPPARPMPINRLAEAGSEAPTPPVAPTILDRAEPAALPDTVLGEADTLVVGGGILGCCVAYFLAQRGVSAILLERHDLNMHGSGSNAGSLHVQISSSYARFADPAIAAAIDRQLPLHRAAIGAWKELADELDVDIEFDVQGGLMVAETEDEAAFLEVKTARENRHGLQTSVLSGHELRSLAPYLSDRIRAASFCPSEGKVNPAIATHAVARAAQRAGVRIFRDAPLMEVERTAQGFVAGTSRGRFRSHRIVNAAGPWADDVAAMAGLSLPVERYPLQMCVTEPAEHFLPHLLQHAGMRLTMKQAKRGNLIIGGGWPALHGAGSDRIGTSRENIERNLWAATRAVDRVAALDLYRTWGGMIHRTPDRSPVLGPTRSCPGFYYATPVPNGYTLGPISARIVADFVAGRRHPLYNEGFSPDRFAQPGAGEPETGRTP